MHTNILKKNNKIFQHFQSIPMTSNSQGQAKGANLYTHSEILWNLQHSTSFAKYIQSTNGDDTKQW